MLAANKQDDDVSNIHRRWSFTRITPGSLRSSYLMMLACASVVIIVSDVSHLRAGSSAIAVHLPLGLAVLVGLTYVDFVMLRGTPVNKMSKVVHVSSFANLLWAITVIVGILASAIFAKPGTTDYIVAGMLLAAGLRIGIFVSVFGASMSRALLICMVQPLLFFFAFVPIQSYRILLEPVGFGFGALFVALAASWATIVDRAARPQIQSTFRVLQAFLSAWTENKPGGLEEYFESRAHRESVSTKIIRFLPVKATTHAGSRNVKDGSNNNNNSSSIRPSSSAIILPDVHPGPFGTVGGSNLPYVLYEKFGKSALVMHSVSDHSLNIPSRQEVDRYIESLSKAIKESSGDTCSLPVQHRQGNATATAVAFGKSALVMLSLAPKGMEDVPQAIRRELESYASSLGMDLLVVDCHNAMGSQLGEQDTLDLVAAARDCLDEVAKSTQEEFSIGFANLSEIQGKEDDDEEDQEDGNNHRSLKGSHDLGQSGIAVIAILTQNTTCILGWADSNNMDNALRDKIVKTLEAKKIKMLEVCSSDTHSTSGKRTSEGYFPLGAASNQDVIADAYHKMCKIAEQRASPSTFSISSIRSEVKVMGEKQFQDYSTALDSAMNITKVFVGITVAAFIAMQILA
jgi:putative membrane protein